METPVRDTPFINIRHEDGKVKINFGIVYRYYKKDNGKLAVFLPGLDISYSADNVEMMRHKGKILGKFFFGYFLDNPTRYSMKNLVWELNALGFRSKNHNEVMPKMANHQLKNADFKAKIMRLPEAFANAESSFENQELTVAA